MTTVAPWPKSGRPKEAPRKILRPCDWGLRGAVTSLETQLGTIEAYNRLVDMAAELKAQIDAGKAKPQTPVYAVSLGYPEEKP
jgi:hypothetical protein